MNKESIERLVRIVHPSLREGYENKTLNGRTIEEVVRSHDEAQTLCDRYEKLLKVAIVVMITWMFGVQTIFGALVGLDQQVVMLQIFALLVPTGFVTYALENRIRKQSRILAFEAGILEKYEEVVNGLNPLSTGNTYHDVHTHDSVSKKAVFLAERVLEAEARYEALRLDPQTSRHEVGRASEWIDKCQAHVEHIIVSMATFGIKTRLQELYAKAAAKA